MIKLHRNYFLQALLFVLAVVGMNSCSCNSKETIEDKLTYLVSDDADVIMTGDISRALSALEISVKDDKLVLPDYLLDFVSTAGGRRSARELDESTDLIKGIDYTNAIVALRFEGEVPDMLISFNVTDEDEFYKSLTDINEDFDIEESGDYKVITNNEKAAFLIKDNLATFVIEHGNPADVDDAVELLDKWIAKAEESPLADWKKSYLTQPAIFSAWYGFGMLNEANPYAMQKLQEQLDAAGVDFKFDELSCGIRLDLAGSSAKANITMFDSNGEVMKNPCAGTFDTSLLDYAISTDYVAASVAINEKGINSFVKAFRTIISKEIESRRNSAYYDSWDEQYISQLTEMSNVVVSLAESFDGNAMVALGTAPGVTLSGSNFTEPSTYHFVAAVKCKPGKTRQIYDLLCQGLDAACASSANNYYDAPIAADSVAVAPAAEAVEVAAPAANFGDSYSNRMRVQNGYNSNYDPIYTYINLYAKIEGNTIVFSNAPISRNGGSNFDRNVFGSNATAVQINLDKDSPLLSAFDLPCGVDATITATDTFDMDITFSGTSQNFVPALVKIINGFN